MPDDLDEQLGRTAVPRQLPPAFRERLERAMLEQDEAPRWQIDGPRPMPEATRARVERAMARTRWTPLLTRGVAAASLLILAASSALVVARTGAPGDLSATPPGPEKPVRPSASAEPAKPPGSLRAFSSRGAFLSYVRELRLATVDTDMNDFVYHGPPPVSVPAGGGEPGGGSEPATNDLPPPVIAVPGPVDSTDGVAERYSSTNVQEEGVDEPDLVKTDGRTLAILSESHLRLLDVRGKRARLIGSLAIANGTGMFLDGERVIHFSRIPDASGRAKRVHAVAGRPWTRLAIIDISRPARPVIEASLELEGDYVSARMVDGVIRLVLRSDRLGPATIREDDGWTLDESATKDAIRRSGVGDWVPHFLVRKQGAAPEGGHLHDWKAISRPPEKTGLGMVTVLTVDPADPRPDEAVSVIGSGEIVYASTTSLYVTSSLEQRARDGLGFSATITRIHRFDISDPRRARYVGSGKVPGYLLNQFALSEFDGHLRAASTLAPPWLDGEDEPESSSVVTILKLDARALTEISSVGDLGKGERIYAVRFIGDRGYVVTFREIDPLYVIDLSDPAKPQVLGELKVPGYSGYLHPIGQHLLLGVGNAADNDGVPGGIQFSMFDVSDPTDPRRLHVRVVGEYGHSSVEDDHHGFMWWASRNLLVVPAWIAYPEGERERFVGALALEVDLEDGFGKPTRLSHTEHAQRDGYDSEITRSLVIRSQLLTISQAGVLVSNLETLDERAWVPFRD